MCRRRSRRIWKVRIIPANAINCDLIAIIYRKVRSRDWDDPDGVIWDDVTENGETLHKALANVDYPKYFEKQTGCVWRFSNHH